jgi:hypothetical protein
MPNVECREYRKGSGRNGPCTADELLPMSVLVNSQGPAKCAFYTGISCGTTGDVTSPADAVGWCGSVNGLIGGKRFQSFICTEDATHF